MQFLIFLSLIGITLFASIRLHGIFSFVSIGVMGAAIYNLPAVLGLELPFYAMAYHVRILFPTPAASDFVVAISWIGLLAGVICAKPRRFRRTSSPSTSAIDVQTMRKIASASAALGIGGLAYLLYTQGLFFVLGERSAQTTDAFSILWKWTAPLGLAASTMARNRKLLLVHLLLLLAIFLRGDRTLVAISAAAVVAALAQENPKWYAFLTPARVIPAVLALMGVFLGKSVYLTAKSGLEGNGWLIPTQSIADQLISQFEPFGTYAQLDYVMNTDLHIGFGEFLKSVLANLLLVPSYFNLSTNFYNELLTASLPAEIRSGVAGNYLAHGWAVGGIAGAVIFYFILPIMLRLCQSQFDARHGTLKVFWCCCGAIIALYAHRNGLDNLFSFIRQVGIVCALVALASMSFLLFKPFHKGRNVGRGA